MISSEIQNEIGLSR